MKVFLCGGGDGQQTVLANKRLNEVIAHDKPLLYVPLAMEQALYPKCLKWIENELKDVNFDGIDMVISKEELYGKNLYDYCAVFIGGGNTYKLLAELKTSGCFKKFSDYIKNDGVVFGGSAGAIIFGEDIESCKYDDKNECNLTDTAGFNVLNGISLLCHYTNNDAEKDLKSTYYLSELSKKRKIIALPEEDTIFVNGKVIEVIGTRPWFRFENGQRQTMTPQIKADLSAFI